jgi:hypothetical protein
MMRTLLVALAACGATSAEGPPPKWEPQLRQMGYLFLHLSNINVINGLNLSREQAVKLRELARQVEAAAPKPLALDIPLSPELEEVRKPWLEARALLLEGKPVPPELAERVGQSRAQESAVLRKTIRPKPLALDTRCASCHTAPRDSSEAPMTLTAPLRALTNRAHSEGLYGPRGLATLGQLNDQVKAVLTDAQHAILGNFSCCLVPPQNLSDPVRAGQAEESQKALDLIRRIRQCPENLWPMMRNGLMAGVDRITEAVSPGAGAERKATVRAEIEKLVDRVRSLSDVEFEMEKGQLTKAVRTALVPGQGDNPLKAAYFLLVPGSSHVYTRYMERLAKTAAAK